MALSISRRLLRSFNSLGRLGTPEVSVRTVSASNGKANVLGDGVESSVFRKKLENRGQNRGKKKEKEIISRKQRRFQRKKKKILPLQLKKPRKSWRSSSPLKEDESIFLACRRYSTSILTPDSSDGSFPSDLLTKRRVSTPERDIGLYQDLVIPVTNFHNEDKGFMCLAGDVFDVPIRKDIIHRVVRWQLAKRQQGTHSTKTISEVSGTGRKPWNQKGTGRARHGTLRGPQFRGGAVMHGPKPRSHAIKLNKKVRRLGLKIALSARAAEGKLMVFEDLELSSHKTKNIVNYFNQLENTKKLLLVDGGPISEKLKLATQNVHYVNVLPSIGLNVYSILLHDTLVMSRDAVNKIVERMHTPINR